MVLSLRNTAVWSLVAADQMRNTVLSRICTKTHCRWGVQLENKKWHISGSTAGNNVIGWRIWKLQCHQWDGVDAVSHQDAPSATFGDHQQYWKDLCMSDSGRQSLHCMASLILSTPFVPWFLTDLQSASSANHSLWHSKMKYSCGRMPWQVPLFKYSNVRQVSPKFHRSVSPCDRKSGWNIHGSATCPADAKTLSQILRPWFKFG